MTTNEATAVAHPNIALIKYWGNRDHSLRIPSNGSISLTLAGLTTTTRVSFEPGLTEDQLAVNGEPEQTDRVRAQLDLIRDRADLSQHASVASEIDFPRGAGIASSAAAFAALSLAGATAAGLELQPRELSVLARRGSGSAARSIFGGYVELIAGEADEDSFASPLAPADHWDLVDLIAIVSAQPKIIGSSTGHSFAETSPLQAGRIADAPRRLSECRAAIADRDFHRLAPLVEQDSDMMHAVMMTSRPSLHYWIPQTIEIMAMVKRLRKDGVATCYTVDAGPNIHCLCTADAEPIVHNALRELLPELVILRATPGSGAHLV